MRRLITAILSVLMFAGLTIFGAAQANAAVTYYYSGPVNCHFGGLVDNYVPLRLVVAKSGSLDRAYQLQYGTATGLPNSEKITQASLREVNPYTGAYAAPWYTQNLPSNKGGTTAGMSTYYSPWFSSGVTVHEVVNVSNENTTCRADFYFHA
jgi:hypothetical protein